MGARAFTCIIGLCHLLHCFACKSHIQWTMHHRKIIIQEAQTAMQYAVSYIILLTPRLRQPPEFWVWLTDTVLIPIRACSSRKPCCCHWHMTHVSLSRFKMLSTIIFSPTFWRCPLLAMSICVTVWCPSVHLSVCMSVPSIKNSSDVQLVCCSPGAVGRYRSMVAGARAAASSRWEPR